jgi:hypothetical protein
MHQLELHLWPLCISITISCMASLLPAPEI